MKKNCAIFFLVIFSHTYPIHKGDQTFTKIVNFFVGILDRKKKQNQAVKAMKYNTRLAWLFRRNPSFSPQTMVDNNPFLGH